MGLISSKQKPIEFNKLSPITQNIIADATERKLKNLEEEGFRNVEVIRDRYEREGRIPPHVDTPRESKTATSYTKKHPAFVMESNEPLDDSKPVDDAKEDTDRSKSKSATSNTPTGEIIPAVGSTTAVGATVSDATNTQEDDPNSPNSNQTVVLYQKKSQHQGKTATSTNSKHPFFPVADNEPVAGNTPAAPNKAIDVTASKTLATNSIKPSQTVILFSTPSQNRMKNIRSDASVRMLPNKSEQFDASSGITPHGSAFIGMAESTPSSKTIDVAKSPAYHKISATIMSSVSHKSLGGVQSFASTRTMDDTVEGSNEIMSGSYSNTSHKPLDVNKSTVSNRTVDESK